MHGNSTYGIEYIIYQCYTNKVLRMGGGHVQQLETTRLFGEIFFSFKKAEPA